MAKKSVVKKVASKKFKRVSNDVIDAVISTLFGVTSWSDDKVIEKVSKMFEVSPAQVERRIDLIND